MKQLRNLFGSMLAVLAVAMMMTACNDVADNPTVPAKLTVTETNGIKVTKLILTSVGTNNVYDLTPYITDKDGMSSFSCDQIFIEANVNDFYYDVYAEDVMGNKYATNVYLNMVRGQQNTLEVTLKQTYAAQTLLDLVTALVNPAKKGAVLTFVFADGSKITYKPALDEDAPQEAYKWWDLKPELSGPMFDALKDLKIQEGKTLADAVDFEKGFQEHYRYAHWDDELQTEVVDAEGDYDIPGKIKITLNLNKVGDPNYYNNGDISEAEREARQKAYNALREASNFEVRFNVEPDEKKDDFYRVKSYTGLEVPKIIYKKDANSEEGEVKVLRDETADFNAVSFKFIAPKADDEVWKEIVTRNPEGVKFLTETNFTYKYPKDDGYQWSRLSGDDWSFYKFSFGWFEVKTTQGGTTWLPNLIGYVISCKIGDQMLKRTFVLQMKNEDGEYELVRGDDPIDPEGDYILGEWVEPVGEELT